MEYQKTRLTQWADTRANQPLATAVANGTYYVVTDENVLEFSDGVTWTTVMTGAAGGGDVFGPASSVDDRIATFDGITGKLIQDGGQTIADVIAAATPGGFTPGAIIFADGSGLLTEDPTKLFWDDANNRMGVGTNTPTTATFQVNGNAQYGVNLPGQYQTTLTAPGVAMGAVTINVVDASGFPTAGILKCQLELIRYTGTTATSFTGCTRGILGTIDAAHATSTIIQLMPFVVAENDSTLTAILLGPGNAYIGASDLVAIGQATTAAVFKVGNQFTVSGTGGIVWQDASAIGNVYMFFDGTNSVFGSRSNTPIQFRTNHTARAYLTSNESLILDGATNSSPGAGTKCIVLGDGTVPSSLASNTAALYANNVGSTVELFAINEAGVATQLTGLPPVTSVPGLNGEDGEDSLPPIPGPPGPAGAAGATGPAGPLGVSGLDGDDGEPIAIPGVPGPAGAAGASILGPPGVDGDDGEDSLVPGPPGAAGVAGATGETGATGLMGPLGPPGDDGEDAVIIPGPAGPQGTPGVAGGSWTAFTQDLGAAHTSGTFDVTGLSGLTADTPVAVLQTAAAIASKGDARDEPEMDTILVTAYALSTTSFRAYWFSAAESVAVGTYAFAWR